MKSLTVDKPTVNTPGKVYNNRELYTHLKALDVVFDLALVKLCYEMGLVGVLPILFEGIKHHPAQFLDIMLLPSYTRSTCNLSLLQQNQPTAATH